MSIPTNNAGGGRTVYNYDFAVGKYWTPHDATPIGDLVTYVSILGYSTVEPRLRVLLPQPDSRLPMPPG